METQLIRRKYIDDYRSTFIHLNNNNIAFNLNQTYHSSFWEWFTLDSVLHLEEDVEWDNLPSDIIEKDPSLCHHNSLINSITHSYNLFCGLVLQNTNTNNASIVLHSYNTYRGKIYDFTYFYNQTRNTFKFSILRLGLSFCPLVWIRQYLDSPYLVARRVAVNQRT